MIIGCKPHDDETQELRCEMCKREDDIMACAEFRKTNDCTPITDGVNMKPNFRSMTGLI